MHPSLHARTRPQHPAVVLGGSGAALTYAELDAASNRGAHLFRRLGLRRGGGVALMLENGLRFFEMAWAAQRSGLYYTCLSTRLTAAEAEYIIRDAGTAVLVASAGLADRAAELAQRLPKLAVFVDGVARSACRDLGQALELMPDSEIGDPSAGLDMLYSSGTTGRPKGVRQPLPEGGLLEPTGLTTLAQQLYGMSGETVFLSPAPLYHSAPLRWSMGVQKLGGTVVVMEQFDPQQALALIDRHRVTHAQWVPTHFIRMLKLPPEVRSRYDLSSLRAVFHAAAPCPIPVKQQMLEWWGPIVHEYYAGTEGNGFTAIGPQEWLERPGSVGRPLNSEVHICDEAGRALPPRSEGLIYFGGGPDFEYHNDPQKTRESRHPNGWSTLGDIGYVDEDGYLYLTDRQSFMIISGGVNIYPQEIENLLITHPSVADVAVIGAPHEDMGEQVIAVVQPVDWSSAGETLAAELAAFARRELSAIKVPRRFEFARELPRHATGKLYKRQIRDAYWADSRASSHRPAGPDAP